ncbi:MAG: DUF192 domain-containing protein [archaeon]|nr:DUF192 domain-containing protein [archaeon]
MKKRLIGLNYRGKKISLEVYRVPKLLRAIGLMFSRREKAKALIFEFGKPVRIPIHSWFVFFPFIAIWTDSENKIVDSKVIHPFTFYVLPSERFTNLIEIPINTRYNFFEIPSIKRKI